MVDMWWWCGIRVGGSRGRRKVTETYYMSLVTAWMGVSLSVSSRYRQTVSQRKKVKQVLVLNHDTMS